MDIKYTYNETEMPIKSAEFQSSFKGDMKLSIQGSEIKLIVECRNSTFNRQDFADFTALVNRINRQINQEVTR